MSERQRIVATGNLPVYRFDADFDCLPPTSIFEIHAVAPAEAGAQVNLVKLGPGLRRGDRLRIYCGAVAVFANLDHRRFQK